MTDSLPQATRGTYEDRDYEVEQPLANTQIALIDLLDRLLKGGVVLTGDLTLSIADVDLVRISLRALIMSVRAEEPREELEELAEEPEPPPVTRTSEELP